MVKISKELYKVLDKINKGVCNKEKVASELLTPNEILVEMINKIKDYEDVLYHYASGFGSEFNRAREVLNKYKK